MSVGQRLFSRVSDHPENIQTIRKLSRQSGNFLDYPETFQTIWKISRLSGNFPKGPETPHYNIRGYGQKLSRRTKTFRMAMPPCHPGFWDSAPLSPLNVNFRLPLVLFQIEIKHRPFGILACQPIQERFQYHAPSVTQCMPSCFKSNLSVSIGLTLPLT